MPSFYDIAPEQLPKDAQYYHNILVITIGVHPSLWQENGCDILWNISEITTAHPTAYCLFVDPAIEEEDSFEIEIESHCVVEVCGNEVSYYSGFDEDDRFDLRDSWRIR